jgi:LysB family phage lysis regulatory protein
MKDIAGQLVALVLVVLLGVAGFFYVHALHADLDKAKTDLTTAQGQTAERDATIRQLLERDRKNAKALQQLETDRAGIQATLDLRETTIRNLERENAEMRTWAAAPLPAAVVRLLDHPQLTGAAAYRERMSAGPAVQPAGNVGGR